MAKDFSFDVVSDYDISEVTNAVDQAQRELGSRYDFKGTSAAIDFMADKAGVKVEGDTEYHISSLIDMLQSKLIKRGLDVKVLDLSKGLVQSGKNWHQEVHFKKGLSSEDAKKLSKIIREQYPKVKAQVQGEEVRVSSGNKDDLQGVMSHLRSRDFEFPLQFTNYR